MMHLLEYDLTPMGQVMTQISELAVPQSHHSLHGILPLFGTYVSFTYVSAFVSFSLITLIKVAQ